MPKSIKKPPAHKVILARLVRHSGELRDEPLIDAQLLLAERLDELCDVLEIMAIPEHEKKGFALSLRKLQKECVRARRPRIDVTKKAILVQLSSKLGFVLRAIETGAS